MDETTWKTTLAALAAGEPADDATLIAFVTGDLVHGFGREAMDPVQYGDAWLRVLDHGPAFGAPSIDALLELAARTPSGEAMRSLVTVLRSALSDDELARRVSALASAAEPRRRAAGDALAYWIQS
ncbi:MAG: hypothetical protein U1F43_17675 [Myxococcota bacterium]